MGALPASPLARIMHESLVEVSPSTLMRLKLLLAVASRAFFSIGAAMAQSVVRKQSMVPMLGWIMPLPLAMPPMRQVLPPMTVSTAASFFTVSVVMMAWAAASLAAAEDSSAACSAGTPSSITEMFRVWPMTPVEDTSTSLASQPMALAAAAHMRAAFSSPWGAQALALPLLARMARALPSARWARSTRMGAAFTTFFVKIPAAAHSTSETISATSFFHVA